MNIDATTLAQRIEMHIRARHGKTSAQCTPSIYWEGLSETVVELLAELWEKTDTEYEKGRMVYYLSAEFLQGRSMLNNLVNLGIYETAREAIKSLGGDLTEVLEAETDASLGNGGLGRLAACFLDSCATGNFPVMGYGILYRYGLFKQRIENGFQVEEPDAWMETGYPFTLPRWEDEVLVHFNDFNVRAIPYDMPITGYGTKNVNTLRLWRAEPIKEFDFELYSEQRFDASVVLRNRSNDIWRVLYPNDTTQEGKILRVRQQYFFVSASLQDAVRRFKKVHGGDLSSLDQYVMMQLNDTHPVVAIPELMRILVDEHHMDWDQAWKITKKCFAYTNHTILAEALEKWSQDIYRYLFPRIYQIIERIDGQFRQDMRNLHMHEDQINKMAPLGEGLIRMAWLAIYGSCSVNGVAALHSNILKDRELKDWYAIYPEKFSNKTNGITPRRWLRSCNPQLSALLTELSGSDAWITNLEKLADLEKYADDENVMKRFMEIKHERKVILADCVSSLTGINLDTHSVFDMQIKRLHEYKRQLMNILYVINLYDRIKGNAPYNTSTEDPARSFPPITVLFGAKSAPGYFRAKATIKFINETARMINTDPDMEGKLKVVFVPNYNVSKAELMFPAADISQQISTAGMEASGTGNMKFMVNGALTLGTLDGANVEIAEALKNEDIYIFGCRSEDIIPTRNYYNPVWQYEHIEGLKQAVDRLVDGSFEDGGTGMFLDIYHGLLQSGGWQKPDYYYVLGDFEAYRTARDEIYTDYLNTSEWARKCWKNICRSGQFSSDRTINDYVEGIWNIPGLAIE